MTHIFFTHRLANLLMKLIKRTHWRMKTKEVMPFLTLRRMKNGKVADQFKNIYQNILSVLLAMTILPLHQKCSPPPAQILFWNKENAVPISKTRIVSFIATTSTLRGSWYLATSTLACQKKKGISVIRETWTKLEGGLFRKQEEST